MGWRKYILPAATLLVLGLFVVYPILSVTLKSLTLAGQVSPDNFINVLGERHFLRTIRDSLLVAGATATLATLLGLTIALTVLKTGLPLRRLFALSAIIPMIIPGFVSTLAYIFLFGRNGLISYQLLKLNWDIYSWRSVLFIQTLDFTSITFLLTAAVLVGVSSRLEDAARNLGASEWQVLKTVTLPLIRPGLLACWLLTFLRSLADFGTPLILGGKFDTLASASYSQLIGTYNMEIAATLNVILLTISLAIFALYLRAQAADAGVRVPVERTERKTIHLGRPLNMVLLAVCLLFSVLTLMLLVSVFLAAFTRHIGADFTLSLEHFRILPQQGWNSTVNTLLFATATCITVALLGIFIAYLITRMEFRGRLLIDLLVTLPFAVPGTFIGVGYALAFSRAPLLLTGTWIIIVAATVIRLLPLGLRSAMSVLLQQDRAIEDASANLGTSRSGTFCRIVVPLAWPALLVSAAYAFVAAVQTLGAIIFLINPRNKVLSVDVFEAVVKGNVGDAAALSMIMLLLTAAGVLVIYAISRQETTQAWFRGNLFPGLPSRPPVVLSKRKSNVGLT